MNLRTLSEETEYFGESNDKKSVFYTVNKRISNESIHIMKNVVQQLIKISSKCPTTLISRYPGLSDYYVEFFLTDNQSDARFIQKSVNNTNIAPFAYALNKQALNLLVHNQLDFYISYYFDLNMNSTIFKQSAFQHDFNYTGQQLSRKRNGHNVNQLIIISQKYIPNLLQLQWIGQEEFNAAQQYILKEKTVETSIIVLNGNQENYLPFNIVSKELQRHPQTVWDIKQYIQYMNIHDVESTTNGLTGNINNIQLIIRQIQSNLNARVQLKLTLKEIKFYNIARQEIENIIKPCTVANFEIQLKQSVIK
ncbi:Helicase-related_protein [Hexamita inflata]|uniref:Helicase-related protein n=1 Tax=Hexamita inflata TaxID=28002 RepID=A0AA86PSA1_9EUKA|nr:Helicase-related protein [Hexamita inflata]